MRWRVVECKAVLPVLLFAAVTSCATMAGAQDADISILGLSEGRAVIAGPNGKPKVYRAGETLPNGARLIKVTPDSAVVEMGGKRRTVGMSTTVSASAPSGDGGTVILTADGQGHFETVGQINGVSVHLLVDTGATMVSMGVSDARRVGIDYLKGQRAYSSTANGVVRAYRVHLDTVKIGDITMSGVDGIVHEGEMPFVLLGMSFLNRVEMNRHGDSLTLVKRF